MADINNRERNDALLTDMLLARSEGKEESGALLYGEQAKGREERIPESSHYRLLFLLKGKALLKNGTDQEWLLHEQQFIMLPPGYIICNTFEISRYFAVECTELKSERNLSYAEELKAAVRDCEPVYPALPIGEKLEKILKGFILYGADTYRYPAIYDAIFIILRSFYTTGEMEALFSPIYSPRGTLG